MSAIQSNISEDALVTLLTDNGIPEKQARAQSKQLSSPWFQYFIKTDPKSFLSQLSMPMLALSGSLDSQVLAEKNIAGIENAVTKNMLTTRIYPGLNHLFQPAKTGLPKEYANIDTTFSSTVSKDMSLWINDHL